MGIELMLRGTHGEPDLDSLFARIERWAGARDDDPKLRTTRIDGESMAIDVHPAAEAIIVNAAASEINLEARTGTAGPGYHRHVCGLARDLAAEIGVRWTHARDDTRFFDKRDGAELERATLEWLQNAAVEILNRKNESARFLLAMPEGHRYEHEGLVATPTGPRDRAWVEAVAADPQQGIDVFAWWDEGRDARYYRELASVLMWREVRWRAPVEETERQTMEAIATWIEKSFALDPTIDLPWPAQAELLQHIGEDSLRATRAQMRARGRSVEIGYRRRAVRVTLSGGFSIEIPGSMAEKWDERGTWVAWDRERTIWFTSLRVEVPPGAREPTTEETLAGLPGIDAEDALELESGPIRGLAAFVDAEENGVTVHRLDGHSAAGADAAVGTIVFKDPEDRRWALSVWGSLDHSR